MWVKSTDPANESTHICEREYTAKEDWSLYYDQSYFGDAEMATYIDEWQSTYDGGVLFGGDPKHSTQAIINTGSRWPRLSLAYDLSYSISSDASNPASSNLANDLFFNRALGGVWGISFILGNPSPEFVTLTFDSPVHTNFMAIHFLSRSPNSRNGQGSSLQEVTTEIIITDDSGNTINTELQGAEDSFYQPIGGAPNYAIPQPTPNWQRVGDADIAHIAQAPANAREHSVSRDQENQVYILGIAFPETQVASITVQHSDLNQTPVNNWVITPYVRQVFGMQAFQPYTYEMLFTLPKGCVVQTPA